MDIKNRGRRNNFFKIVLFNFLYDYKRSVKLNAKIFNFVRYTKIMFLQIYYFSFIIFSLEYCFQDEKFIVILIKHRLY
jgi:hypothetical protein